MTEDGLDVVALTEDEELSLLAARINNAFHGMPFLGGAGSGMVSSTVAETAKLAVIAHNLEVLQSRLVEHVAHHAAVLNELGRLQRVFAGARAFLGELSHPPGSSSAETV